MFVQCTLKYQYYHRETQRKRSKGRDTECPGWENLAMLWTAVQTTPGAAEGTMGKERIGKKGCDLLGIFQYPPAQWDSKRTSAELDLGKGIVSRGLDRTIMCWVTRAGKPTRLAEVLAKGEENLGWVRGKGDAEEGRCRPEINYRGEDHTSSR